jgi:hypothetical protein
MRIRLAVLASVVAALFGAAPASAIGPVGPAAGLDLPQAVAEPALFGFRVRVGGFGRRSRARRSYQASRRRAVYAARRDERPVELRPNDGARAREVGGELGAPPGRASVQGEGGGRSFFPAPAASSPAAAASAASAGSAGPEAKGAGRARGRRSGWVDPPAPSR